MKNVTLDVHNVLLRMSVLNVELVLIMLGTDAYVQLGHFITLLQPNVKVGVQLRCMLTLLGNV